MSKVICGVCLHQNDSFCEFKKSKVRLKKRRVCEKFQKDTEKISFKQPTQTFRRPDWTWWTKKERKDYIKKMTLVAAERATQKKDIQMVNTGDSKHPLTGDLSRFTTTAKKLDGESK